MVKYQWFKNKEEFQYGGIGLKLETLKILLLDKQKQYSIKVKGKTHKISYEIKIKDDSNKVRYFGVSAINDNIYIIRLTNSKEYDNESFYKKSDFLALCTQVSRKLK